MTGENGRPDRLEDDPAEQELTEVERGRLIDKEREQARVSRLREVEDKLKAEGKVLDLKAAHMRCFHSGSSGNENLRGDGPAA